MQVTAVGSPERRKWFGGFKQIIEVRPNEAASTDRPIRRITVTGRSVDDFVGIASGIDAWLQSAHALSHAQDDMGLIGFINHQMHIEEEWRERGLKVRGLR